MSRKVRLLYENRCIGRVAEFRLEDLWLLILDKLHCPLEQRPPDPSQQDQLTSRRAG